MSIQHALIVVCFLFMLIAIVCAIVDVEARKPKKNIRLPRKVSWDRAAQYYNDTN